MNSRFGTSLLLERRTFGASLIGDVHEVFYNSLKLQIYSFIVVFLVHFTSLTLLVCLHFPHFLIITLLIVLFQEFI